MINKTLNAITVGLHSIFGDNYHYYVENVEQNLTVPAFTVDTIIPIMRSTNNSTYYWTMPCVVCYFTDKKQTLKKDCYSVALQVLEAIELITIDGRLVRGQDISYQIEDDVLQVFITYKFWADKPKTDETEMESLVETKVSTG